MNQLKFLIALLGVWGLVGCVEIQDAEDEAVPEIETLSFRDLAVEGKMFLWAGDVLNEEEFLKISSDELLSQDMHSGPLDYNFRNIHFYPGSTLYTLGQVVRLNAEELTSEGGELATFPQDAVAAQNRAGRDGGHIVLKSPSAQGFLKITLRGERGGQGLSGNAPTDALRGAPGKAYSGPIMNTGIFSECSSSAPAHRAVSGSPGKKGFPGSRGASGGATGSLEAVVGAALDLQIVKEPGRGGEGGLGGAGGAGGITPRSACDQFRKTPIQAAQGEAGDTGEVGVAGIEQAACVLRSGQYVCR